MAGRSWKLLLCLRQARATPRHRALTTHLPQLDNSAVSKQIVPISVPERGIRSIVIHHRRVPWFLAVACFLFLTSSIKAQVAEQKPDISTAPVATVSFDHLALRQNESANVDVWLTNASDRDEIVTLTIAGTNLIAWRDSPCSESKTPDPPTLELGTLRAHSNVHRRLCASVSSQVYVGDYNILFSFQYHIASSPPIDGLVTIEKTVRLYFLGTDSIAGIPLAFSCFILPGFFFWLAAELVGAFKGMGQGLGEKTIYSVMISFAIVALTSWGASFSLALGVSIRKLGYLSAIGAGAGLVCGLADRWVQRVRARKQLQRKLNPDEKYDVVLEKLLEKTSAWIRPKITIRLKGDTKEQYTGSLYGKSDTEIVLVGWFRVTVSAGNKTVENMEKERQFAQIVSWARKHNIPIERLRPIRVKIGEAEEQETEQKYVLSWKNEEVLGVGAEFETKEAEALEIKKSASP